MAVSKKPRLYVCFFFLGKSSLSFVHIFSWFNSLTTLHIILFIAINIPEEPETAVGFAMPTTPTSATLVAPTPIGPSNYYCLLCTFFN